MRLFAGLSTSLLAVLVVSGCRTPNRESGVQEAPGASDSAAPDVAQRATAYVVKDGWIHQNTCAGDGTQAVVSASGAAQSSGCVSRQLKTVADFRAKFIELWPSKNAGQAMQPDQVAVLDGALGDGRAAAAKGLKPLTAEQYAALYERYLGLTEAALDVDSQAARQSPVEDGGMGLTQSGYQFLDEHITVPFGNVVTTPIWALVITPPPATGSIQVVLENDRGARCDSSIIGVNVATADNPVLGPLRAYGNGVFASNVWGRSLQITHIQVVMSQVAWTTGYCRIRAVTGTATTPSGGVTTRSGTLRGCEPPTIPEACTMHGDTTVSCETTVNGARFLQPAAGNDCMTLVELNRQVCTRWQIGRGWPATCTYRNIR